MTVEQTKIAVKSQKCSMSAERKSAGRTTPICSEEQPGVFGMSKETRWRPADLRIAGFTADWRGIRLARRGSARIFLERIHHACGVDKRRPGVDGRGDS